MGKSKESREDLIKELEATSVVGNFSKASELIDKIEQIDNIVWDFEAGKYIPVA